jgi:DNA-directed RNA polymerase subunit M/transcription elongation factor TFIIS
MDQQSTPTKTCPKCGSNEYTFRSRKKVEPDPANGQPESWETKYRCKACNHEWRVKVPARPSEAQ